MYMNNEIVLALKRKSIINIEKKVVNAGNAGGGLVVKVGWYLISFI